MIKRVVDIGPGGYRVQEKLEKWLKNKTSLYSGEIKVTLGNTEPVLVFQIDIAKPNYDHLQHMQAVWPELEKLSEAGSRNAFLHDEPHNQAIAVIDAPLQKLEAALDKELGLDKSR